MTSKTFKNISLFVMGGLLFAGYVLAGWVGLYAHQSLVEMDTTAYLETALQIRRTGGILSFIPNCLTGVYAEATQHPLYLLLISSFADRSFDFFVTAKLLSSVVGFVFLISAFLVVKRLFDVTSAILLVCLLLLNSTFFRLTTMVASESLLGLFFLLFWVSASKGFEKNHYWILSGAAASLAFLTKSIAILTLPVFAASVLWVHRSGIRAVCINKYFWGFFLSFIIVASPLFIRNIVVYGTPLFSNSRYVLWIDEWKEYDRMIEGRSEKPGMRYYFERHSVEEFFDEITRKSLERNWQMLSDGLKPFAFWERELNLEPLRGFHEKSVPWQGLWASGILMLFLYGLFRSRKSPHAAITFFSLAAFLIFIGWYSKIFPKTPPTRLLYPILILILVYAAVGFSSIAKRIHIPLVLGFLVFYVFSLFHFAPWTKGDVKSFYRMDPFITMQLKWVVDQVPENERVLVGEVFLNHMFYFRDRIRHEFVEWPTVTSFAELENFIREEKIRYGALDLATVGNNYPAYRSHYAVDRFKGLRNTRALPDWMEVVPRDPKIPPFYQLLKFRVTDA